LHRIEAIAARCFCAAGAEHRVPARERFPGKQFGLGNILAEDKSYMFAVGASPGIPTIDVSFMADEAGT
jgi:hypothetical protein